MNIFSNGLFKIIQYSSITLIIFYALSVNIANAIDDEQEVIVYNWSNYIPEGILDDFTEETGIKVKYSTYDSNEVMFAKLEILRGRGYDVLVPSTNLVEKMYKEGLLQEINKDLVNNFKYLDKDLLNRGYDPNNKYSIPYLWGSTGLAVNGSEIEIKKIRYWQDLWNENFKNKILLLNDMRGVFHMALKINGHSTNSTDKEEIKQAYELLRPLMKNIKILSSNQTSNEFTSNNVILGILWNGEAAKAKLHNPNIQYIYPKEGALFWIDSFVIPSYAPNVGNAHTFINYMLRPDIAQRCMEELNTASANLTAKAFLSEEIKNNPTIFPPQNLVKKSEFQRDVGSVLKTYQLYWDKLKSNQ